MESSRNARVKTFIAHIKTITVLNRATTGCLTVLTLQETMVGPGWSVNHLHFCDGKVKFLEHQPEYRRGIRQKRKPGKIENFLKFWTYWNNPSFPTVGCLAFLYDTILCCFLLSLCLPSFSPLWQFFSENHRYWTHFICWLHCYGPQCLHMWFKWEVFPTGSWVWKLGLQ